MIAIDTVSGAGLWNNAQSSVTWAHTCNGDNRTLYVAVDSYANKTTGVTYNGVAMTFIDKKWTNINQRYCSVYILVAPASGQNNVVYSLSGNDYCASHAVSLTGTKQSGQPQAYTAGNTNFVATVTQTVATTGVCWLIWFVDINGTGTAGNGTTYIAQGAGGNRLFRSTTAVNAGNNSLELTSCATNYSAPIILVAIEELFVATPAYLKTKNTLASAKIKTINTLAIAKIKTINTLA